MLRPRIIPCLLIHNGGLVKTMRFTEPKYVGDPLNAVRIFNEKEVDELFVADIDASVAAREPNYSLIAKLASECRMPLCYAGGVKTPEQFERIISLGVEKVAIGSAAIESPGLVVQAARRVGNQSVVVVMDVRQSGLLRRYEVFTHNGKRPSGWHPAELARKMAAEGVGEIVVNSIDRDGTMKGYDMDLVQAVREAVKVPLSILGGAGDLNHVRELVARHGTIGAAAGSLFVFKGKYRAVLIQYPSREEKDTICG
ncbi:MAG TPA: AglZ/HisF2 family acetamidino modification protein [Opitutaceae bacterium]|nr:AglZ/HisF2 family acetamidino modification protein [Opitutaceae bacterium]